MIRTIGSLFSGIGGLELGLEAALGARVRWQVELDDYARAVLARHWPDAARYPDVRDVGAHNLEPVDLVCGGFPCDGVSRAGKRDGLAHPLSALWHEMARVLRQLRPRYVVVENSDTLIVRGLPTVLGDLADLGYRARWDRVSAADVGAPHLRERTFVVAWLADARGVDAERRRVGDALDGSTRSTRRKGHSERNASRDRGAGQWEWSRTRQCYAPRLDHGDGVRLEERRLAVAAPPEGNDVERASQRSVESSVGGDAPGLSRGLDGGAELRARAKAIVAHRWPARFRARAFRDEPPRTARDVAHRRRRIRALGESVCPQVAYAIGCVVAAIDAELAARVA